MQPDDIFALRELLAELDPEYDFMFIDTYGTTGYLVYNALAAADEVIIPMKAGSWSDSGVAQALTSIKRAQQRYNPSLKVHGILPTMTDRTIHTAAMLEDTQGAYANLVYPLEVTHSTKVNQANTLGMPIVVYEPEHPAAVAYQQLAERLLNGQ
jgi:chromosome partitioning protein